MSTTNVLSVKDANAAMATGAQDPTGKANVKSMEYHRQVLQNKMAEDGSDKQYVSPSDGIMSPCTAKLTALRSKHVSKAKPKSLFAQASVKKLEGDSLFGMPKNATTSQ